MRASPITATSQAQRVMGERCTLRMPTEFYILLATQRLALFGTCAVFLAPMILYGLMIRSRPLGFTTCPVAEDLTVCCYLHVISNCPVSYTHLTLPTKRIV